jgi:hypothetical protein
LPRHRGEEHTCGVPTAARRFYIPTSRRHHPVFRGEPKRTADPEANSNIFEQIRDRGQQKGRDMGGKGIVRRSALALGLTFALGVVEAQAQQTSTVGTDLRCARVVGRGSRDILYDQPGLALDALFLVQGVAAH